MKSIELLSELLAGKKIVRGEKRYEYGGKLKNNYFVYDDGSSTSLEDFLRLTGVSDWRVVEDKFYFRDLKLGDVFKFKDVDSKWIKASLNNGNKTILIAISYSGQDWSYAGEDAEVVKC